MFNTAVLFIVFNRPNETDRVFDAIKKARPKRLYIAADGPRPGVVSDVQKCQMVRKIVNRITWHCSTQTLFRTANMGCKKAVSTALDWFFEHESAGIILEDDCLPHQSFFPFCEHLLDRYKTEERVMHISGNNFMPTHLPPTRPYYFSRIPHIWGWATWRRAWKLYDPNMTSLPTFLANRGMRGIFNDYFAQEYWEDVFRKTYRHAIDTWDYQWTYTLFTHKGLSINPAVNLVSNIGFGPDASRTTDPHHTFANMPTFPLTSFQDPKHIRIDTVADRFILNQNFEAHAMGYVKRKLIKPINRRLYPLYRLRYKYFLGKT